jgi:hypothetical protein
MRRRILTILLAVLVLAVVVPFGAALTLDRRLPLTTGAQLRAHVAAPVESAALAEPAALALTGSVLIGLGVAARRVV